MFCYISQLHIDRFSWDFYNRNSFHEMIKMRDKHSMLTLKMHVFFSISAPCWQIFMRLLQQGFFWWDNQKSLISRRPSASSPLPAFNLYTHTHIHKYIYVWKCVGLLSFCAKCSTESNVHVISELISMLYWFPL